MQLYLLIVLSVDAVALSVDAVALSVLSCFAFRGLSEDDNTGYETQYQW